MIRELLHNAIAHQDYRLSGKINVLEYEEKLVFKNEGSFIPGSIEQAIQSGYKPPYYRNPLLANAMSKTGMIDQNAIGIRNVFDIQRARLLPMPTYDLSSPDRVSVTIYGEVLNEKYTQLLAAEPDLDLGAVFLLDMVQKGQPISKEQAKALRDRGLVEGRYPKLLISSKVAAVIGSHEEYVRAKRARDRCLQGADREAPRNQAVQPSRNHRRNRPRASGRHDEGAEGQARELPAPRAQERGEGPSQRSHVAWEMGAAGLGWQKRRLN